jgi:hypothetical protein
VIRVYVEGVGLCGPGLAGWEASAPVLRGAAAYVQAEAVLPALHLLPANERRRAPKTAILALAVGAAACAAAGRDPASLAAIFTSSGGDGGTIHDILHVLASPVRELSPTKFHNSVHNAASGYWGIATGATSASTSLCAHDGSFAAGLLEAAALLAARQPVVLIAYDVPYPAPLHNARPVAAMFGLALVLSPHATTASCACLEVGLLPGLQAPTVAAPALEALRQGTPAARSLPLLAALARAAAADVVLDYLPGLAMRVNIIPRPAHGWQEAV